MKLLKIERTGVESFRVEFDNGLEGVAVLEHALLDDLIGRGVLLDDGKLSPSTGDDAEEIFQRLLAGTSWIKSPRYDAKAAAGMSVEAKLLMLEHHHAAETTFLINVIRRLGDELCR